MSRGKNRGKNREVNHHQKYGRDIKKKA